MEQHISPDKGMNRRPVGDSKVASKMEEYEALIAFTIKVIPEDRLDSYLKAGSATGFKVKKIAGEGEEYSDPITGFDGGKVETKKVRGKGNIAVSIEKPKDAKYHTRFWDYLINLQPKKT